MNRISFHTFLFNFISGIVPSFACLLLCCISQTRAAEAPTPHIVVILADDLGWADVGFHGDEIKTPALDSLAKSGVKLEQFYVQPVCSPTRSSLMTGRYPIRQGLQVGVIRPWADYGLPLDERLLPQALKEAGYSTAICGKWHLGLHEPQYLPTKRGFDFQYGHYCGALDYFTHMRDGGLDWHRQDQTLREEGYTTHLVGAEAVKRVKEHDPNKPLFLYVPFNAVHSPLQVPEQYLKPYAHIEDKKRRTYAGMTACMDEAIGQIVQALDERGMRNNTLILFSSDNGGPVNLGANNGPLRGAKGQLYEGGVRVPAIANWPGKLQPGVNNEPLHIVDFYPTLLKLAGVSLEQKHALDGRDLWPVLTAGKTGLHDDILHNVTPNEGAVRMGEWKLVVHGRQTGGDNKKAKKKQSEPKIELFHISQDPNEKTNLAETEPERVKQLLSRLDSYAAAAVEPKGSSIPNFKTPKVWGVQDE